MEATKQTVSKANKITSPMEMVYSNMSHLNKEIETKGYPLENFLTKKEQTGLKIIFNHKGKRIAYEYYRKHNPEMAMMYLKFVSKYTWAQYITWDSLNKRFSG